MKRALLVALLLLPAGGLARAAEPADYEVHEWGFLMANAPRDPRALEEYLKSLPGEVGQLAMSQGAVRTVQNSAPVPARGTPVNGATEDEPSRSNSPDQPPGQPAIPRNDDTVQGQPQIFVTPLLPFNGFLGDPFIWFHSRRPLEVKLRVDLGINKPIAWWPRCWDKGNTVTWRKLRLSASMPEGKSFSSLGRRDTAFAGLAKQARDVQASVICAGSRVERFVMYDFLAFSWTELRVRREFGALVVDNLGSEPISGIFLMDESLPEGQAYYVPSLAARETGRRAERGSDGYLSVVDFRIRLCDRLVSMGLHQDEAACMVKALCSQKAFFASKGIKVVHLMNRSDIDSLSRLELDPAPAVLKRVWVMMLWNALAYDGLAPVFRDQAQSASLAKQVRASGGTPAQVKRALERIEEERAKDDSRKTRG